MLFQISSIDRFGLLRTTCSQQLSAEQMSYWKEPVGWLIVAELILLHDSLLRQVHRLLCFVLRVGDAGPGDQRTDSSTSFAVLKPAGASGAILERASRGRPSVRSACATRLLAASAVAFAYR